MIGHSVDERYWLEAEIGVGGLGSVYRAVQTKLQRPVAVKLLHESCGVTSIQRRRFEREARALAVLEHPNIVSVLDYGVEADRPYLVMELLEGETLAQRVKRGPLPLDKALSIAQQLLSALGFMHAAQLVHRDVKPSNVFLQRLRGGRERVKVLDFGLAKFTAPEVPDADATLTRDGTIVGTPAYMSPEQATGELVDARSDVYAVGVILFQMLSGRLPFEGDAIEQVRSHLVAPIPPLARVPADRQIDAVLQELIERAMAKRREDRFTDGHEMLQALLKSFPTLLHAEMLSGKDADESWRSDETKTAAETSETMTSLREPQRRSFLGRIGEGIRQLVLTGYRLFAAVSALIVVILIAIIALLSRNASDRADLSALQRRVSDRLIQRPLLEPAPAEPEAEPVAGGASQRDAPAPLWAGDAALQLASLPPRLISPHVTIPFALSPAQLMAASSSDTGGAPDSASASASGPGADSAPSPSDANAAPSDEGANAAPSGEAAATAQATPTPSVAGSPGAAAAATSLSAATNASAKAATPSVAVRTGSAPPSAAPPAGAIAQGASAGGVRPGVSLPSGAPGPSPEQSGAKAIGDTPGSANAARSGAPPPQLMAASTANVPGPPPARDPWLPSSPKELRGIRRIVLLGGPGSDKTVIALRDYNVAHPGDPRAHILLGQLYYNRFWRADSVSQFATALQMDLSARGSPEILPALLGLVIHGKVAREAEQLIARAYGSEAVALIDGILANMKDESAAQRLRNLRARLDAQPRLPQIKE